MKKVAIVVDNWKLPTFKKGLIQEGYTEFSVNPFKGPTSVITLKVPVVKLLEFKKLVQKLQIDSSLSN